MESSTERTPRCAPRAARLFYVVGVNDELKLGRRDGLGRKNSLIVFSSCLNVLTNPGRIRGYIETFVRVRYPQYFYAHNS